MVEIKQHTLDNIYVNFSEMNGAVPSGDVVGKIKS